MHNTIFYDHWFQYFTDTCAVTVSEVVYLARPVGLRQRAVELKITSNRHSLALSQTHNITHTFVQDWHFSDHVLPCSQCIELISSACTPSHALVVCARLVCASVMPELQAQHNDSGMYSKTCDGAVALRSLSQKRNTTCRTCTSGKTCCLPRCLPTNQPLRLLLSLSFSFSLSLPWWLICCPTYLPLSLSPTHTHTHAHTHRTPPPLSPGQNSLLMLVSASTDCPPNESLHRSSTDVVKWLDSEHHTPDKRLLTGRWLFIWTAAIDVVTV